MRIGPAQQCLGTNDSARIQVDDRLVIQHEFVVLQGAPHFVFQLHLLLSLLVHVFDEHLVPVASEALGAVHRHVGFAYQCLCIPAMLGIEGDSDAGGDVKFAPFGSYGQGDGAEHLLGDLEQVHVGVYVGQAHDEFIAADAGDRVAFAQTL